MLTLSRMFHLLNAACAHKKKAVILVKAFLKMKTLKWDIVYKHSQNGGGWDGRGNLQCNLLIYILWVLLAQKLMSIKEKKKVLLYNAHSLFTVQWAHS